MFSKEILGKLLVKTAEGEIQWEDKGTQPTIKNYQAKKGSLLIKVASIFQKQTTEAEYYKLTLEVWEDGKLILDEANKYVDDGYGDLDAGTVNVDKMLNLIHDIEQQLKKRREEPAKRQKDAIIQHILQELQ